MLRRYLPRQEFSSYQDFSENYRVNVPANFNFAYDVVDRLAIEQPERKAIVWCDDKDGEATFTFADLRDLSNRAANLFAGWGIGKGDAVMLILKRRHEYWPALLALHKLGAIAIPATHLLSSKDIVYRVKAADVRMIVCVNEEPIRGHIEEAEKHVRLRGKVAVGGAAAGWLDYSTALTQASAEFARPSGRRGTCNRDISLLYFTSGTTGMPKMVRHNFVYPLGHILTAKYWQNVQPGGLHFTVADTGWAKAAWGKIYGQWLAGSAVMVYDYDKFSPKRLLDVIARYGVTTFCAPPTVYRFLIKEKLEARLFPALKYCVVAGEPLNPEVYQQFLNATGIRLMEGYGQTELTVAVATFPWMDPRPGSMGKPAPGYEVDVIDDDGRSCEVGEEGQIVLRAARRGPPVGMFDGYYRDAKLTAAVWRRGIYYTGDMAWRDEDGYYWFVGRADDVIKSSGYRIGPFEVESALLEHPAVLECAVTGVPDAARGQAVKATVVLARHYTPSDELAAVLQEHVKEVTASYKYPRVIEFVPELPKTISGKIRRVAIRDHDRRQR